MEKFLQNQVIEAIAVILDKVRDSGELNLGTVPTIAVEPPKRPEWGDFSSSLAMTLASQVRQSPLKVAELLATGLRAQFSDVFVRVTVASPGFLNLTLHPLRWIQVLRMIQDKGPLYGTSNIGKGKRILLEFVSANPTGPLHVGHGRGAALGQAMARLLVSVGFMVSREYYINDAGRQLQLLGRSVYARYREHWGKPSAFPEDGYHGDYIKIVAESVVKTQGPTLLDNSSDDAEMLCAQLASQMLLDRIKEDLATFGVEFDSWFSETSLHTAGLIQQSLEELRQKKLLIEEDGAWWFRSSQFGDEKDRVAQKQDGSYTYLAADMAYHRQKLDRGFDTLINIWGADHHGYIPRMEATVQAFGFAKEALRIVLVQMVSLRRGGQKIEMSKRAGEFVTLREVIDEVGPDAAKFFFLMRRADTHLDFDLELAKQQSSDNPVYYVQYAHARLASLFRVAQERQVPLPTIQNVDQALLIQDEELGLIKTLAQYPFVVENSAMALEPHRVTFYLQELAAQLHAYYNKNRVLPSLDPERNTGDAGDNIKLGASEHSTALSQERIYESISPDLTAARLALLRQVQTVIGNGLAILGISAPEKM
ncbi:arginine--tRNA ligase [Candidatus Nitrospira neomarina]|uniref:Arginine--tRNA ligase n=1 Tax=Candidatus Nitrospira neomarina TaxID=3020899 RepID=A0AA96GEF5_9BACT|nr:arginine--tRNA ligase [Candidatus Nitrospira neomarina]WNM60338.1 arginine--tRNA ligase [Candidatus Nitrospira neomarina]